MSENGFAEGLACGQGMNGGYGCGGGFGWGGDWIALIFLAAIFGGGGWGGGFGGGGANVFGEVQRGFDTTGINNKLNGLENGLCDGFYAQNTNLLNGFSGISREIASCCCETNRNIDGVRYDAQKNTCDIITAVHEEGEKTRSLIKENEIQVLRDKVAELQLAQSQCAQNAYLTNTIRPYPVPAYPACRPSCDGGWGWNYGGAA